MKKYVAAIAAIVMVVVFICSAVPALAEAYYNPVQDEFYELKDRVKSVESDSNDLLKADFIELIEEEKSLLYDYKFTVKDAFIKVVGHEIYFITLEKSDLFGWDIKTYDIYVPAYYEGFEAELAEKISSGEKVDCDGFFYHHDNSFTEYIQIFP